MPNINSPPKEGDVYKTVRIEDHTFELRYGYYEEFERETGEPVVVYPDLMGQLYTRDGSPIVTAVQEPCGHYAGAAEEGGCVDCIHYSSPDEDIGICICEHNQKKPSGGSER